MMEIKQSFCKVFPKKAVWLIILYKSLLKLNLQSIIANLDIT